ncbi:MAG: hypothetical protein KJP19_01170 [Deltaproteobacteria bacterium]|nr:hypothetical protein [Deltaproteobacteria bacterium]
MLQKEYGPTGGHPTQLWRSAVDRYRFEGSCRRRRKSSASQERRSGMRRGLKGAGYDSWKTSRNKALHA